MESCACWMTRRDCYHTSYRLASYLSLPAVTSNYFPEGSFTKFYDENLEDKYVGAAGCNCWRKLAILV